MKTIFAQAPLALPDAPAGAPLLKFSAFIRHLIDNGDRFNMTGPGIRQGARIESALDKSKADDFETWDGGCTLDDADWKALAAESEEPIANGQKAGYPAVVFTSPEGERTKVSFGRGITRFLDAIANATEQK